MSPYNYPLCDSFNLRLIYWPLNRIYHDLFRVAVQYLHSCPKNVTDDCHDRVVWGGAEFLSHEISKIAFSVRSNFISFMNTKTWKY